MRKKLTAEKRKEKCLKNPHANTETGERQEK
jgi:hypothetical protein